MEFLHDWWEARHGRTPEEKWQRAFDAVAPHIDDHEWLMSRGWAINWRLLARFDERKLRRRLGAE